MLTGYFIFFFTTNNVSARESEGDMEEYVGKREESESVKEGESEFKSGKAEAKK